MLCYVMLLNFSSVKVKPCVCRNGPRPAGGSPAVTVGHHRAILSTQESWQDSIRARHGFEFSRREAGEALVLARWHCQIAGSWGRKVGCPDEETRA